MLLDWGPEVLWCLHDFFWISLLAKYTVRNFSAGQDPSDGSVATSSCALILSCSVAIRCAACIHSYSHERLLHLHRLSCSEEPVSGSVRNHISSRHVSCALVLVAVLHATVFSVKSDSPFSCVLCSASGVQLPLYACASCPVATVPDASTRDMCRKISNDCPKTGESGYAQ